MPRRLVEIDDPHDHLGRVYISGITAVEANKPAGCTEDLCISLYFYPLDLDKPVIHLTHALTDIEANAVRKRRALLLIPADLQQKAEEMGLRVEGYLAYGTPRFWRTILRCSKLDQKINPGEAIQDILRYFKGHIAAIRVLGDIHLYNDIPTKTLEDPTPIYRDYGLPPEALAYIPEINSRLLEKDLEPIRIEAPPSVIEALKNIHPRAVHRKTRKKAEIDALF